MRYRFMICLALACTGASADTYRWVDSAGKTVISDMPPPGKAKDLVKTGGKAEADDGLPFATRKAAESFPVILYTAANCLADCKNARDLLNARGIPFTEKMVQKQEEIDELKQLVGDTYIPSIKVGNQSFRGFNAAAYNNLLDLANYPKTAPFGSKPAGSSK